MLKKDRYINLIPIACFIVVILTMLSYQMRTSTTIVIGDGYFHLSRFFDIAEQIKNHNFNYFQTNYGFDQSGRIINATYGPAFAYIMGFILFISGSFLRFQLISAFISLLIASYGMYYVVNRVTNNMPISIILSLVYITHQPTLNNGITFGSISAMLLPYALLCGVKMIKDKTHPVSWLQLGLIMSIVAQTHLMSTILFSLMLVPFAIVGFINTNNKKSMLINLFAAVGLTLLLTLNVWSILVYFHSINNLSDPIESTGLALGTIKYDMADWLLILVAIMQLIYVVFNFKKSKLNTTATLTGFGFLLIGSNLFPWNHIQAAFPELISSFQYPRRLLLLAVPLILLGIGITSKQIIQNRHTWKLGIISLLFLTFVTVYGHWTQVNTFYSVNAVFNKNIQAACKNPYSDNLFKYLNIPAPDYLPKYNKMSGSKKAELYNSDVVLKKNNFQHKVINGKLQLNWTSNTTTKTQLPIVMYRDSKLVVNGKTKKHITKNAIGVPTVKAKKGINTAILCFNAPKWWKTIVLLTILGWITMIIHLGIVVINKIRFHYNKR